MRTVDTVLQEQAKKDPFGVFALFFSMMG